MAPAVLLSSTLSTRHTQAFGQNVKPLRSQSRGLCAIQCNQRISKELVEVASDKVSVLLHLCRDMPVQTKGHICLIYVSCAVCLQVYKHQQT